MSPGLKVGKLSM